MRVNKKRLFMLFALCLLQKPSVSFAQLSEAQLSKAMTSAANTKEIGASLLNSIIIDVETGLDITFVEQDVGVRNIRVGDVFDPTDATRKGKDRKQAAIIRITGAPFETMIDIEELTLEGLNKNNEKVFSLSRFDIMNDGAGAAITILPFDNDSSYVFAIGGSVENIKNLESIYEGFNVININYL